MTPLVDSKMLARLAALPGADGRNLAVELVDGYLTQVPRVLGELSALSPEADAPMLRRSAHSLRGSALMLGANAFAEQLSRLELHAEHGETAASIEALRVVASEWPATAAALSAATSAWRAEPRAL